MLQRILEQLKEFETALVANTIGYIDPTPPEQLYLSGAIQSVTPALGPTVGRAVTCEMDSSTPGGEADLDLYWRQIEEMESADVPLIWVVKAVGSRPEHECIIGDGMAKTLYAAGCVGLVTDGGVRDIAGLHTIPFAAYSRGRTVHHCALRIRSIDKAVEIGGVTIRSGDVLHANAEGVIRIPEACLSSLPERTAAMRAFEQEAHLALRLHIPVEQKCAEVSGLLAKYGFDASAAACADGQLSSAEPRNGPRRI